MRTVLALIAAATLTLTIAAQPRGQAPSDQGFTDTPMLPGLPYHVHDPNRLKPRVVAPAAQPGGAPSDAEVLFDGKDLSQWTPATLGVPGNLGARQPKAVVRVPVFDDQPPTSFQRLAERILA